MRAQLGALQAGGAVEDLGAGIVAGGAAAGGINPDEILARGGRRIPDPQGSIVAALAILLLAKGKTFFNRLKVEDALARSDKAAIGVFAEFLNRQCTEGALQVPAIGDLRRG